MPDFSRLWRKHRHIAPPGTLGLAASSYSSSKRNLETSVALRLSVSALELQVRLLLFLLSYSGAPKRCALVPAVRRPSNVTRLRLFLNNTTTLGRQTCQSALWSFRCVCSYFCFRILELQSAALHSVTAVTNLLDRRHVTEPAVGLSSLRMGGM
jgi:hypothetical protein